jgi:hypothetical protein
MPADLSVLFCADPLVPTRVDEHFAAEASAVRDSGGTVALIDHDALCRGDADAAVRRVPRDSGPWWYRGWMMPVPAYAALAVALERRGVTLRVPPRRFQSAHELPRWYATFSAVTPESDWSDWPPGVVPTEQNVEAFVSFLVPGAAIVKDFVKSRKHEWAEACFIPDVTDLAHATSVIARMIELQGEDLQGGIVVRRYEEFRREEGRTVEVRVWWVDGVPVMTTAHPDTPDLTADPDLTAVSPLVAALGCAFVTTDMARHRDGRWRVVEVGDGQVSDLPANTDITPLLRSLAEPTTIDAPIRCPECGATGKPILYGRPTLAAWAAVKRGELAAYGCLRPEDAPQWTCGGGHEWSTTEEHRAAVVNAVIDDD